MQLLSINVGQPKDIDYDGKTVRTAIFKKPISGAVKVQQLAIDGDGQADLRVHGGIDKAVYAYSAHHFPYWTQTLNGRPIQYGEFGENLTIDEIDETTWCIGDHIKIGDVELMISQPRIPCYKLGIAFDNKHMVRLFKQALRPGGYFRVITPGVIEAGMGVERQENHQARVSIKALYQAIIDRTADGAQETLKLAQTLPDLSDALKENIERALI